MSQTRRLKRSNIFKSACLSVMDTCSNTKLLALGANNRMSATIQHQRWCFGTVWRKKNITFQLCRQKNTGYLKCSLWLYSIQSIFFVNQCVNWPVKTQKPVIRHSVERLDIDLHCITAFTPGSSSDI